MGHEETSSQLMTSQKANQRRSKKIRTLKNEELTEQTIKGIGASKGIPRIRGKKQSGEEERGDKCFRVQNWKDEELKKDPTLIKGRVKNGGGDALSGDEALMRTEAGLTNQNHGGAGMNVVRSGGHTTPLWQTITNINWRSGIDLREGCIVRGRSYEGWGRQQTRVKGTRLGLLISTKYPTEKKTKQEDG